MPKRKTEEVSGERISTGDGAVEIKENKERGRLARMIENVHASLLGVTCRDALPDEHFSWLARQRA